MSANNAHKLKLLYLIRILQEETDPEVGLSMPQIIERLREHDIAAERKAIYRDFQALRDMGFDVVKIPTRPVQYALVRSELGFDDVMMLIDVVQSCRFITERKSNQLVKSLKGLLSNRERKLLARRVHVRDRVKSQSESVFHSVDIIHEALQHRRKVEFLYFSYGTNMERVARHGGKRYILTPVKVIYAESNYYLAAYDDEAEMMKTFRIDRMELLQMSAKPATRNEVTANYEFEDFAYRSFSMYHGEPARVTLHVKAGLMDTVVDRFGRDMELVRFSSKSADVRVGVLKSPQFFGWIAGLNGDVTIKAPRKLAEEYRDWLTKLAACQ